ncbi:tRNA pseudouridine(55) synthase TruB [soil metagenome]
MTDFSDSGVLLLDKPVGLSSNQALGRVRRLFGQRKAGHTGTLDPFATGLLPIGFGDATKFTASLLDADKTYVALAQFGVRTDSGDRDGKVIAKAAPQVDADALETVLERFRGEQDQTPPMYSALKRDGKPLYELARQGIEVERTPRRIVIRTLRTIELTGSLWRFEVRCSKGTYIRTLADDIGLALGCGAHLVELRRTGVADLTIDEAVTLEQIDALPAPERRSLWRAADALLGNVERVGIDAELAARFLHGQRVRIEPISDSPGDRDASDDKDLVAVHGPQGFIGTARLQSGVLMPQRLISTESP